MVVILAIEVVVDAGVVPIGVDIEIGVAFVSVVVVTGGVVMFGVEEMVGFSVCDSVFLLYRAITGEKIFSIFHTAINCHLVHGVPEQMQIFWREEVVSSHVVVDLLYDL